MARIATRNGKPAHIEAAPRLRASDLDPRELPEWLQHEADRAQAATGGSPNWEPKAPWGRAILIAAALAALTLLASWNWPQ